jgi:hypothetical protein
MARDGTKLLAVLIDADNVSASAAEAILREIAAYGEPSLRRVYGDWSSQALGNWKKVALDLGLVMHQQSANTKGKNASDIGLVIDAMDILHGGKFDGFVLVSSDSDFTRLASRIREDGLEVIGIGEEKTPPALRNVCNRFVFIENILRETDAPETVKPARAAKQPEAPASKPAAPEKVSFAAAMPLVRKAMNAIDPDGEWYSLGQLGQFIQRENPDFDPRTYGSAKLSDLIKRSEAFDLRQGQGNNLEVRRRD